MTAAQPTTATSGLIHEPKFDDLENILGSVYDLYHLIATISGQMLDLERAVPDDIRKRRIDRVSALVEVALRQTRTLHNGIAHAVDESIDAEHVAKEKTAA